VPKWALVLLVIAVAAGATFALFEFVLIARLPAELVGRWHVSEGEMAGATLEFRRNGTMTVRMTVAGKDYLMEGTATVSGKTLRTTAENPLTGKAETGAQTIVTLTETELVTQDGKGTRVTMRRSP
jgi:uncharacterized protein (TIGR03066 family)